jgi:hypothetical protein
MRCRCAEAVPLGKLWVSARKGALTMTRIGAAMVVLGMLTGPALAQQRFAGSDFVEQALTGCHDGVHAIADADVEQQSISLRAGPRELRVFFGSVGVDYAEQGSAGRSHRREARLTLTCTNTLACVWSGPWDEQRATARAEHGIVLLSALSLSNQSLVLYCPDIPAAQALHRALLAFQRINAP